jgi:hypothetical protein
MGRGMVMKKKTDMKEERNSKNTHKKNIEKI